MVFDINKSVSELNADIEKMSYWAYHWKLQFNPDPNKQANEVIFSQKPSSNNLSYPPIKFNNHCVISVRIRSYSGPYFPAFGLNLERYSVSLRIQSE